MRPARIVWVVGITATFVIPAVPQTDLSEFRTPPSQLVAAIERFEVDRDALVRSYPVAISLTREVRLREFFEQWRALLATIDFDGLSLDDQVDAVLFRGELAFELRRLDFGRRQYDETAPLLPFAALITELEESRRMMKPIDSASAAGRLDAANKQIEDLRKAIEAGLKQKGAAAASAPSSEASSDAAAASSKVATSTSADGVPAFAVGDIRKSAASRAASTAQSLRRTLRNWYGFYNTYDPVFTWWMAQPYQALDQSLEAYTRFLREKLVGVKPDDENAIVGDPVGREWLQSELDHELIPYTPEELIAIGEREFAWCEAEMKKASAELGFGEDYLQAIEAVKTRFVEPGQQPAMIRELAYEAIEYLEVNRLLTIPPLARDGWRMEMMSPERQLVTPFFTGGEVISVSYPTSTMTHEQKMMSMRGNNRHFCRATVHHELIPGHHLQGFMNARYKTHRRLFQTPFWLEGWAVYWETLLWDRGFARSAEDRVGMLFWRMHRAARIIFSLKFHLEQMTPDECIDFLVNKVGHERDNATAEVRRSFGGQYSTLYQCAYMIGALQFRALRRELVEGGGMTDRAMHDAILRNNSIPVEMVRSILTNQRMTADYRSTWRFAETP